MRVALYLCGPHHPNSSSQPSLEKNSGQIPTEGHVKYYLSGILQTVKVIQNMVWGTVTAKRSQRRQDNKMWYGKLDALLEQKESTQ